MARPMRGHPIPQSQQGGAEKPEKNVSVPQQEGQADTTRGKAVADYDLDTDYKPERSDPDIKTVDEEEEISDSKIQNRSTLSQDVASENDKPQSCRKDQTGTWGMRT